MSISRKIRKNIVRHKESGLSELQVFYPQGFKAYTGFLVILSFFIIIAGVVILICAFSDERNRTVDKYLVLGLFILMLYTLPFYVFMLTWKLRTRRISLTLSDEKIVLNGVLRTKIIKISDIEVVKRANTKIEAILVKTKKNRNEESNSKIVIPVIWFGKENIKKFIQIIKNQKLNKKIKIDLYIPL